MRLMTVRIGISSNEALIESGHELRSCSHMIQRRDLLAIAKFLVALIMHINRIYTSCFDERTTLPNNEYSAINHA